MKKNTFILAFAHFRLRAKQSCEAKSIDLAHLRVKLDLFLVLRWPTAAPRWPTSEHHRVHTLSSSQGMVNIAELRKITEVPFPFPYAQFLALQEW